MNQSPNDPFILLMRMLPHSEYMETFLELVIAYNYCIFYIITNANAPLGIGVGVGVGVGVGNVNDTVDKYNNDNSDQQVYTVNTTTTKTTVAYAITVTNYAGLTNPKPRMVRKGMILDRAAVLHQSIKLAMSKSIRYDYDIHAFVHPEAVEVVPWLKKLGYHVHIKDTPFNITEIQNPVLIKAQNNGCCKEKVSINEKKKKKKKRTEQKLLRIEFEIIFLQGLASYYYSQLQPNRSVELNRRYYNTMVDNPYYNSEKLNRTNMCRTLEPDMTCQDCRKTSLDEIYTTHFTSCGKPEWCDKPRQLLCTKLLIQWHKVRTTLEQEWSKKYPIHLYDPKGGEYD